jgi:tetratricopeptide (TPR) repeat protein
MPFPRAVKASNTVLGILLMASGIFLMASGVFLLGASSCYAQQTSADQPAPTKRTIDLVWPWEDEVLARFTMRFFDHLYSNEYDACTAIVDSLDQLYPDDPMVSVLRVRIFRDVIREVDVSKKERQKEFDQLKQLFVPLRERAEALLAKDPRDPRAHLALGWEGMMTGQVQIMMKDVFGANSSTKRARRNLEIVLEQHPDSPDAKALLGGYLYSVDTLPKFLKLLKWIPFLGIPSGDRKLGLQMVMEAAASRAPSTRDFLLFSAFLDAFYEGEFVRGSRTMLRFYSENPHNSRFGISLSLMAPFDPGEALAADRYWRILSNEWESMRAGQSSRTPWWDGRDLWSVALAVRMKLMAAYQWEAMGRPDFARALYQDLCTDSLCQKRRVKGPAHLGLARTAALMGDANTALRATDVILETKELKPWRDHAKKLRREIEKHPGNHPVRRWSEASLPLIEALEASADSAGNSPRRRGFAFPRSRLRDLEREHANSGDPVLTKLLADAYYLAGLPEKAMDLYEEVLSLTEKPSLWALHFQTLLNRSYILEKRGQVKEALQTMKDAADTIEEVDLIRYPVDARIDALERAGAS